MDAGTSDLVTKPVERELVITRVFDAPRSLVFEAWAKPEHMVRWWGPSGFTLPTCEMDFRPGGAYRLNMRSPQGREYGVKGVYREVVVPERIVFTCILDHNPHEVLTTVTFAEHGGKTTLTVRQVFRAESDATRGAQQGWSESLDRLAEHLSKA